MKKLTATISALLLIVGMSFAQTKTAETASITFSSKKKGLSNTNSEVTSSLDLEAKTITFALPSSGFKFSSNAQQKHFDGPDGFDTEKHADISFTGNILTEADLSAEGTHEVNVKGTMNLHGVEKEFEAPGTITNAGGTLTVASEFPLSRADFGITAKYANMLDDDLKITVAGSYK